jgi:hypothetical protein
MRYFIHIVTDGERIRDPEGAEFADLEAARLEASQSARDLMAGELVAGRPVPLGWRVQIADLDGTVHLTIPFAALVFGENELLSRYGARAFPRVTDGNVIERAKAIMLRTQRQNDELRHGLEQLRSHVRALARMSGSLPTWSASRFRTSEES